MKPGFLARYLLINSFLVILSNSADMYTSPFHLEWKELKREDLFTVSRYQSWLLKYKQGCQGKVAQHSLNKLSAVIILLPSLDHLLVTSVSLQLLHAVGSVNSKTTLKNKLKLFKQFSLPCSFHFFFLNYMESINLKAAIPTKAFLKTILHVTLAKR